ncbi:uncharacterized protein Dvar_51680 [Desulfosarcina variabilis str. Montpellier]|uniref:hypothetical protein n=1 Tax=Desulfosarcina variabilis TaxID=2300 RepID=UPI003AFAD102
MEDDEFRIFWDYKRKGSGGTNGALNRIKIFEALRNSQVFCHRYEQNRQKTKINNISSLFSGIGLSVHIELDVLNKSNIGFLSKWWIGQ